MPYPSDNQAACIQGIGTFGQLLSLDSGSYEISFYASGRPSYGNNPIKVYLWHT